MLRVGGYRLNDHSSACVKELQQQYRGALLALLFVEQRARAAPPVFACCACNAHCRRVSARCSPTVHCHACVRFVPQRREQLKHYGTSSLKQQHKQTGASKTRQMLLDPQGSDKDPLLVLMRHTATSKNGTAVTGHRRRMPVRWVQQKAAALAWRSAAFVCYRKTVCAAKTSRGWFTRICSLAQRLLALCGRC